MQATAQGVNLENAQYYAQGENSTANRHAKATTWLNVDCTSKGKVFADGYTGSSASSGGFRTIGEPFQRMEAVNGPVIFVDGAGKLKVERFGENTETKVSDGMVISFVSGKLAVTTLGGHEERQFGLEEIFVKSISVETIEAGLGQLAGQRLTIRPDFHTRRGNVTVVEIFAPNRHARPIFGEAPDANKTLLIMERLDK